MALVVGNSHYNQSTYRGAKLQDLKQSVNDAAAIAKKLNAMGFERENIVYRLDVKTQEISGLLNDFYEKLTPCSVAVVYYSGHGFNMYGDDYFPTVNSKIKTQFDIPRNSLALSIILDMMTQAGVQTQIVFLDACRENPYQLPIKGASQGGLIPLETPPGTQILYAAQPKEVAQTGEGKYSVFTEVLLNYLDKPDLALNELITKVTEDVRAKTHNTQIPYQSSNLSEKFYFLRTTAPKSEELKASTVTNKDRAALRVAVEPDTVSMSPGSFAPVNYQFTETKGLNVQIDTEDIQFYTTTGEPIGTGNKGGRILGGSFQVDGGGTGIYHNNIYLPPDIVKAARQGKSDVVQLRHVFHCHDQNGNELTLLAILRIQITPGSLSVTDWWRAS
ncbi:caspase family protein [Paraburkholderia terrae]